MYMHIYHRFSEDFHVKVVSLTISQPHSLMFMKQQLGLRIPIAV